MSSTDLRRLERTIAVLLRRLLAASYDIGRLEPEDPEFARRRAAASATAQKLRQAIREYGRLAAVAAEADMSRRVNARLWKLYHALPEPDPAAPIDPRWREWRTALLAEIQDAGR